MVKNEKEGKIYVALPNGYSFVYNTKKFHVESMWQGGAEQRPEHARNLAIQSNPWQQNLRSLEGEWLGAELAGDEVVFRYAMSGKDGRVEIRERISINQQGVVLSFSLVHPKQAFNMNYRMRQSSYRLVETTGQKRGRGHVQYIHLGQTDYQITMYFQEGGDHFPAGYTLEPITLPKLPKGYLFEPAGLDFDADGTLYVSTRTAGVWTYKKGVWKQFADGLYDALGLRVRKDGIYVMQKPELTRLVDEDGDGVAERYETVASNFRFAGSYHEFAYGPRYDSQGNAYFSLNLSAGVGHKISKSEGIQMLTPLGFRGFVMKLSANGELSPYAHGFRSPAGIGINKKDELFITDNQGDWVPSSYLIHVRPGGFHGHPASLLDTPKYGGGETLNSKTVYDIPKKVPEIKESDFRPLRLPPTVWLPHEEYANSPGNPEFCETSKFGPFEGQMFIAELTKESILRVQLQRVGGAYQGTVFPFLRPLPSGGFRLRFSPNGELYVGQLSRGWGNGKTGLHKLSWDGKTMPFEMKSVTLTTKGFDIRMTLPLAPGAKLKPSQVLMSSFRYNYWKLYGSERIDKTIIEPDNIRLSEDRQTIHLSLPLKAGFLYAIELVDVVAEDGKNLVNRTCCYTLNQLVKEDTK